MRSRLVRATEIRLRRIMAGFFANTRRYQNGSWREDSSTDPLVMADTASEANLIAAHFRPEWYNEQNPDVQSSGLDPLTHYIQYGDAESRDPSPDFCVSLYKARYPEVLTYGMTTLAHWVTIGKERGYRAEKAADDTWAIENSFELEILAPEFDAAWYSMHNPDVDPDKALLHYARYGWLEGRDPTPTFSTTGYLVRNEDVKAARINPYYHWLTEGRKEGREFQNNVEHVSGLAFQLEIMRPHFDARYYILRNNLDNETPRGSISLDFIDSNNSSEDALKHYATVGWKDGLDPSREFSTSGYLSVYDDVRQAGLNPFYHYLTQGIKEGRDGKPQTNYRSSILSSIKSRLEQQRVADSIEIELSDSKAVAKKAISELCKSSSVLTISHDDYNNNVGGIQLLLRRYALNYANSSAGHVHLFPAKPELIFSNSNIDAWGVIVANKFEGYVRQSEFLENLKIETRSLKKASKPTGRLCETVIVHSFLGHRPAEIHQLLTELRPQTRLFWVHDYASICSGFQLMRNDVEWCGAPDPSSDACTVCIHGMDRHAQFREHESILINHQFEAAAPSDYAASMFRRYYPHLRITTHSHIDLKFLKEEPRLDMVIKVAFLGHPAAHKGWYDFVQLADNFFSDPRFRFIHVATGSPCLSSVEFVEAPLSAEGESVLSRIVAEQQIDFVFVGSLWAETFCLIAYEAVAGGASIITYPVSGNVVQLASTHGGAIVKDLASASALLNDLSIEDLPANRKIYQMIRPM
ncbi:hypothetical protein AU375_03605 [Methylobacterium radiotolerans]|nr:hypothetical protein AU375_03605 [Methylobacterium radiotolerans]